MLENYNLKIIEYQNGDGENCAAEICWHKKLNLFNISFYSCQNDELVFAEDFSRETMTRLRDQLSEIIELAISEAPNFEHNEYDEKTTITDGVQ